MLDKSIECYKKSIELNNLYHRAYDGLSFIYSKNGNYDIAKEYAIKSLDLNPNNPEILNRLGYIYIQTGNPENALEYFKKAYSLDRNDITIIKNLVLANAIFKNYKDSIPILQQYLKTNPNIADGHYLLATTLYEDKGLQPGKVPLQPGHSLWL